MTTAATGPQASSVVSGDLAEGARLTARVGNVEFPVGSDSQGPSPYDLLSSSLAACTVMTIRFHAARMRYPVSHVDVAVSYHRELENQQPYFERAITLEGPLNEGQRDNLMRAANMCPVAKALSTQIRTRRAEIMEDQSVGGPADYSHDLQELSIPNIDPD
jgi:putative redox protein